MQIGAYLLKKSQELLRNYAPTKKQKVNEIVETQDGWQKYKMTARIHNAIQENKWKT